MNCFLGKKYWFQGSQIELQSVFGHSETIYVIVDSKLQYKSILWFSKTIHKLGIKQFCLIKTKTIKSNL